ncbi:uncharacterized protein [Apostichopus japonicus]|uniref:uncharacterized protein n=1 Tax=Stichopus japonicus TaxID=307972 RepID=UPI003AB4D11C
MVRIFFFGAACVLCLVARTIINVPLHVNMESVGICADVNPSEITSLNQTLDLTDVRCYPDLEWNSTVPRSTNSSFDKASLPMCPLQPLKMTVQDTTNNLRNKICFKYAKTNLTNTEDEYSQIQNDHVTTGANTKHLLSSLVYCMIDQYHKVNHRVQRITREAFVDLHSWTKYIFDILSSSVDELLVFHREFISFVYQVFFGMLSYFEQIPIENSMDYQWNMTCPITTKNDRLKDALCYLQMTTLLFVLTCGLIIQTVLHTYMRRLSNRNHDPNEHLPALYDNADGGIPEDKNRICRTVQLLPWGSSSYDTRALEENIGHKIRQRRFLHPTRYSPTITIDHGARSIKDVFRHESSSSVYTTSIVTTSSVLSSPTVTTSSRSSSPIVSSFSRLPPVLCHSSFFTVTPDVICGLNNRKRSAHNRPDEISTSTSASNHESTIGGTSTKYGVPYRNEARTLVLPSVTDTTSRLSLSSSGSTSSLLSLSIISQEDYTAPSVDDVMAFDSLYSETEANEDPFEDDSYHLELLFPSSDDSLYSTIRENDNPRNNGAYAIDLPLEFDNFCTVSPPSSDSSSSLVSPSSSSSLLTQEDYVDPFADDIFASDRSNTQSQADESSVFDFEASWDSETDEDEVSHYGNPYHLELPFANSFGSDEFTQMYDIPHRHEPRRLDLPFGYENISTISSLSSSSSNITSSLASSSSNSSISSEDDVIDDVNNDDILMSSGGSTYQPTEYSSFEYSSGLTTDEDEDPFDDDSYHLELLFPSCDGSLDSAVIQANDVPNRNRACALELPLATDYIIRPLRLNHIAETASRSNDLRTEITEQLTGTGSLPTRLLYQELLFSSCDGILNSTVIQANDFTNRNRACALELPLATDYIIRPHRLNYIVETANRSNDLRTEITEQLTGTGSLPNSLLYPNLEETLFFLTLTLFQKRFFN